MPVNITTGKQFDDSESDTNVNVGKLTDLDLKLGDQHQRSKMQLKVSGGEVEAIGTVRPSANKRPANDVSASQIWAKGSFFLVAFILVAAVIGIMATNNHWYFVPLSVVGALLVLYLLALILVPNGSLTEKGFISVLGFYVRMAFASRRKDRQVS